MKAEQYRLACHVMAKVGDVLGMVTVRSHREQKVAAGWQEVRLTAGVLSLKILFHTIVLFWLLKIHKEPLLRLRSTVAGLAKGVMASTGAAPTGAFNPVRDQLARHRTSFAAVAQALSDATPPVAVSSPHLAEYQAFAQSLREMAVLKASMQTVAAQAVGRRQGGGSLNAAWLASRQVPAR